MAVGTPDLVRPRQRRFERPPGEEGGRVLLVVGPLLAVHLGEGALYRSRGLDQIHTGVSGPGGGRVQRSAWECGGCLSYSVWACGAEFAGVRGIGGGGSCVLHAEERGGEGFGREGVSMLERCTDGARMMGRNDVTMKMRVVRCKYPYLCCSSRMMDETILRQRTLCLLAIRD